MQSETAPAPAPDVLRNLCLSISVCKAGYFLNGSICSECPLGEYKADIGDSTSCDVCPGNTSTQGTGATGSILCGEMPFKIASKVPVCIQQVNLFAMRIFSTSNSAWSFLRPCFLLPSHFHPFIPAPLQFPSLLHFHFFSALFSFFLCSLLLFIFFQCFLIFWCILPSKTIGKSILPWLSSTDMLR